MEQCTWGSDRETTPIKRKNERSIVEIFLGGRHFVVPSSDDELRAFNVDVCMSWCYCMC